MVEERRRFERIGRLKYCFQSILTNALMRFSQVVGKEKREITKNIIPRVIRNVIGKTLS